MTKPRNPYEPRETDGEFGAHDWDWYGTPEDTNYRNDEPEINWPKVIRSVIMMALFVFFIINFIGG